MNQNLSFEQKMEELKRDYTAQLPKKIETISNHWNQLNEQWKHEQLKQLHLNVHTLIGTSGTFGFHDLSRSARKLELLLKPLLLQPDCPPNAELSHQIQENIKTLSFGFD